MTWGRRILTHALVLALGFIWGMEFQPSTDVDWTAVGAIATAAAVVVALWPTVDASLRLTQRKSSLRAVLRGLLIESMAAEQAKRVANRPELESDPPIAHVLPDLWEDVLSLTPIECRLLVDLPRRFRLAERAGHRSSAAADFIDACDLACSEIDKRNPIAVVNPTDELLKHRQKYPGDDRASRWS